MFHRVIPWQKLIGAVVIGIAGTCILEAFPISQHVKPWLRFGDITEFVVGIGLALLGCALLRGYHWARRVLLCLALIGAFLHLKGTVPRLFSPHSFSGISPEAARPLVQHTILQETADLLLTVSISIFVVLFLCHRDIVAEFRKP